MPLLQNSRRPIEEKPGNVDSTCHTSFRRKRTARRMEIRRLYAVPAGFETEGGLYHRGLRRFGDSHLSLSRLVARTTCTPRHPICVGDRACHEKGVPKESRPLLVFRKCLFQNIREFLIIQSVIRKGFEHPLHILECASLYRVFSTIKNLFSIFESNAARANEAERR